jgi:hypothetical protein
MKLVKLTIHMAGGTLHSVTMPERDALHLFHNYAQGNLGGTMAVNHKLGYAIVGDTIAAMFAERVKDGRQINELPEGPPSEFEIEEASSNGNSPFRPSIHPASI